MPDYILKHIDQLGELEARAFDLSPPDEEKRVLLVKKNKTIYCYRNSCPHTGAPLNWYGDRFFDSEKKYLQCALHGALFRVEDGYCVAGPCSGQSLVSIPVNVITGRLHICL